MIQLCKLTKQPKSYQKDHREMKINRYENKMGQRPQKQVQKEGQTDLYEAQKNHENMYD